MKPMPHAQAAGNKSRTWSPFGILNPVKRVDNHAVSMMPNGLPTTKATTMPMTIGDTNSSADSEPRCTPVANSAKIGNASSAENGCNLSW